EELGPGLEPLVQDRPPERRRVRRPHGGGPLRDQARPRLGGLLDLLPPQLEELVGRRVSHGSPQCSASQPETFGQQWRAAPRPARSEMWPPGSSTYSFSLLPTTSTSARTHAGGAMESSLAPTTKTGQAMFSRRTGRPPMTSSPR